MPWVKLDDAFPEHRKVDSVSDGAFRLHVAGICFSSRMLTDGFIPKDRVGRLTPKVRESHIAELVDADLWAPVVGGWSIHDYLEYNPSRAEVNERREVERKRKDKQRKRGASASARASDGSFTSHRDNQRDTRQDSARTTGGTTGGSHGGSHPLPDPPLGGRSGSHLHAVGSPSAPAAAGGTDSEDAPTPEEMRAAAARMREIRKERFG